MPQPGDSPVAVARGPVPVKTITPMDATLDCVALQLPADLDMRLAVHSLPDRTGVNDYDGPGAYVTQGAELMMVSALAKAGARQVNRTATSIAEWELSQAMEQRLGEGSRVAVGDTTVAFRPIQAGYYLGSTHTVYGGITELDFDLVSDGFEAHIAGIGGKARGYYIGIGLDVVVADSRSTEIVLARSYRKQIWGQEVEANLFRFWDIGSGGNDIGDVGVELFDLRLDQYAAFAEQTANNWASAGSVQGLDMSATNGFNIANFDLSDMTGAADIELTQLTYNVTQDINNGVQAHGSVVGPALSGVNLGNIVTFVVAE